MFIIKYGIETVNIDVTNICLTKLCFNNIIKIPEKDDNRAHYFGDPLLGILKSIFITNNLGQTTEYNEKMEILINIETEIITAVDNDFYENKLETIHNSVKLDFGSFKEEYPEQIMAIKYLTGNEKVLEIGGNIGRNTLVIASILKENCKHFVSLESDSFIASQLIHNRDINKFNFHIENSALSKRKLMQRGWDTIVVTDGILDGYNPVNTINFSELYSKYNIDFDTLVLDCEGAFYYILMDMPEILQNIKLIIMENDYKDLSHKQYVDSILKQNNFVVDYSESGGWGACYNNFFEVWIKSV
jgi:FkbM family methyltransferase